MERIRCRSKIVEEQKETYDLLVVAEAEIVLDYEVFVPVRNGNTVDCQDGNRRQGGGRE